ncbi:hemerythrin domain-containing protein [Propionivibrio soli]|uniref:hemerythrin domain-containing protein n=1 Tax=Propionivibrio soli TaxID=2976531 RepID=UPI0021E6EF20|nr:hemerythrin domain-containing protein [Propionivibrio soli]
MNSIRELLANDHRHCDDGFAEVEQAVRKGEWDKAEAAFLRFRDAVLRHLDIEENVLFPAFEDRTGMRMGPTQVMRNEHAQMRDLLTLTGVALTQRDADEYLGNAETLLILTQQHNMKEENILYPMCDQHLSADRDGLLTILSAGIASTASAGGGV